MTVLKRYTPVKPMTSNEVKAFENKNGLTLPVALVEFFLLAGSDYDELLRGGGGAIQSLANYDYIKKVADGLLEKYAVHLENFFPFLEYGDQFLFVYLNEGDDPAVYRFEAELAFCGEDYIQGSASWGLPKGVSKLSDSFSILINATLL